MESRRLFLKRMSQATLLATTGRCFARSASRSSDDLTSNLPQLTTIPSGGPIPEKVKSIVVDNRNPMILAGPQLHEAALTLLFEDAVRLITDCTTARQARQAGFPLVWQGRKQMEIQSIRRFRPTAVPSFSLHTLPTW